MKHAIWIGFWIFAVAAEVGLAVSLRSITFGVYGMLALALIAYNIREKAKARAAAEAEEMRRLVSELETLERR